MSQIDLGSANGMRYGLEVKSQESVKHPDIKFKIIKESDFFIFMELFFGTQSCRGYLTEIEDFKCIFVIDEHNPKTDLQAIERMLMNDDQIIFSKDLVAL